MKKCIVFIGIFLCCSFSCSQAAQLEDVEWSNYIGGSDNEWGRVVAVDSTGNIIFASTTLSSDAKTTPDAYQQTFGGFVDILVRKFSPDGNLLWSTYIGRSGEEAVFTIAIDNDNNIWIGGQTTSDDFPSTPNSYATVNQGGTADALLFKLSSDGKALLYSTLLGGTAYDAIIGVSCDPLGNVWVSGRSFGQKLQCTPNAPQKSKSDKYDGFFACLNYDYSMRVVSYWGYNHDDSLEDVCIDKQGHPVFVGFSMSQNIEFSGYTFQNVNKGGRDVLLFKLNPNTFMEEWSTLFGGSADDIGYNITVDKDNNIDISGYTSSADFPVSNNAADISLDGARDYFVAQFTNDGHLKWSTYLGGSKNEGSDGWATYHGGIISDKSGNVFVGGSTMSSDFPIGEAYQKTNNGNTEGFVAKFDINGNFLDGTYIGGTGIDIVHKIVLLNNEKVIISGMTTSKDFPILGNTDDNHLEGSYDAFLVKFGKSAPIDEFSTFSYSDKCNTNLSITVENPVGLSYSVKNIINCSVSPVYIDSTKISINVSVINTYLWAFWNIEFVSPNGNKEIFCDSVLASSSSAFWKFAQDSIPYDTIDTRTVYTKYLRVYNISNAPQTLLKPSMAINTNFSMHDSFFPVVIPAKDSVDIPIYYAPFMSYLTQRDTVIFEDFCFAHRVPLSGFAENTDYTVGTRCGADVTMSSKPKDYTHNKVEVIPNPIVGSGAIRIFVEGKAKVSVSLYSEIGEFTKNVFTGEITSSAELPFDTENLASGLFIAVIEIDGRMYYTNFVVKK